MAIKAGVGLNNDKESYNAGFNATRNAMKQADSKKPSVVIVFASSIFDQKEVVRGVREASGGASLVGCSDAGEITNDGPTTESVAVMAIESDTIQFTTGLGRNIQAGVREAGQAMAKDVQENSPNTLEALVMFPDVLTGNGAEIVRGVQDVLGKNFPIVGGAAGDDFAFKKTYEYRDDKVESGAVAGLGLSGNFSMGVGLGHGWVPIGVPMTVTKSKDAVLYEVDGKPAIQIYEEYFGEQIKKFKEEPLARAAITYPLGIKIEGVDDYLIRDPITIGDDGSITCAAEIPEGSELRVMIGSKEQAVSAAENAAKDLINDFEAVGSTPRFILMFNCIAREKFFGSEAQDEINTVRNMIGRDVPLLGFYTYGEQAPLGGEIQDRSKTESRFFNETVVVFGIGD